MELISINMVAESYSKLCEAVKKVNEYVKVVSYDGEDMLVEKFELPEETL